MDYSTSDGAVDTAYYGVDKGSTRIYLLNTWGKRINDLSKDTAVTQNITVTFTVDHLEQAKYLIGDVNQDGRVDVTDAVLLSKAVNGSVTVSDAQRETMDCDGDGDITANDVTTLMRFLVHLETELPPKQ